MYYILAESETHFVVDQLKWGVPIFVTLIGIFAGLHKWKMELRAKRVIELCEEVLTHLYEVRGLLVAYWHPAMAKLESEVLKHEKNAPHPPNTPEGEFAAKFRYIRESLDKKRAFIDLN